MTLTLSANGATPLRYQWRLNGRKIPSATVFNLPGAVPNPASVLLRECALAASPPSRAVEAGDGTVRIIPRESRDVVDRAIRVENFAGASGAARR